LFEAIVSPKSMIVVVVDRLHAGMLGAYGNTWINSTHFDELASQSFLFDQAFIQSPNLDAIYRALWHGESAGRAGNTPSEASFPHLVNSAGWHTALITDEHDLLHHPAAATFTEQKVIEIADTKEAASDVADTQMARLFMTATEWLAAARDPFCLWLHSRGMGGCWDAPLDLRRAFADEEDPVPPDFVDPPKRLLAENFDPDELLGITHAYAGQVMLLDTCLGALADHLDESGFAATTQLTFLSARGFPLGEHGRIGACDQALYNETVQVPWLMRFPDNAGRMARSQALVTSSDLPGTLLEWLDIDRSKLASGRATSLMPIVRGDESMLRDHVYLTSGRERAIRTPAWFLRQPESGAVELYAKPGDRWEVNEAARLCEEVVVGLQQTLAAHEQAGETDVPPLGEELVSQWD
jgi:arylsulfatase A-like enzyme